MKTSSKALLTLACALLLVVASVMGTLAYLTDTDTVNNTFTVGKVDIKLDEAKVNDDGKPVKKDETVVSTDKLQDAERVKGNSYHLLPGHSYTKDPTLTVLSGSEKSYVRLLVTVTFQKEIPEDMKKLKLEGDIITGYNADWVRGEDVVVTTEGEGESAHTVLTYEYRYKTTVAGQVVDTETGKTEDGDNKLPALFTGIQVPEKWGNKEMADVGGFTINVVGQAIQADGFDTAAEAWEAYPVGG